MYVIHYHHESIPNTDTKFELIVHHHLIFGGTKDQYLLHFNLIIHHILSLNPLSFSGLIVVLDSPAQFVIVDNSNKATPLS